ncbi:MAG TPA: hypothetical protein VFU11_04030 [Solirubrobacterales bacterium]|nr:hypothetical protein [Solirubrobacterales bacterium]
MLSALGIAACGGSSSGDSGPVAVSFVDAQVVDGGVAVTYQASGTTGEDWPVLKISVRRTSTSLPPSSAEVRPIEQEDLVVVSSEARPGEDLVVYGSLFSEDGKRVQLPEQNFRP